jgi:hypothetical protein
MSGNSHEELFERMCKMCRDKGDVKFSCIGAEGDPDTKIIIVCQNCNHFYSEEEWSEYLRSLIREAPSSSSAA